MDVIVFQHCSPGKNIFCFSIPSHCPFCEKALRDTCMLVPPFVLPSPLTNLRCDEYHSAMGFLCSVVVRPTKSRFLHDYQDQDDLHVGILSPEGFIYSYSEEGVRRENRGDWEHSLLVPIPHSTLAKSTAVEHQLYSLLSSKIWSKERYHEDSHNCFDFVVEFMRHLGDLSVTKELFCTRHILPSTKKLAKYITLYREIKSKGAVVYDIGI